MNGAEMAKLIAFVAVAFGLVATSTAFAAERTVTLVVKNMYCADCPFVVKKSLEAVPGVVKAEVSLRDKTAIVTFDDSKADVSVLTKATTNAGYPSSPKS
jgi:mercuric ion binding protein